MFKDQLNDILPGSGKAKGNKVENEFGWSGMPKGGIVVNRLRKTSINTVQGPGCQPNNLNFTGVTPQEDESGSGM